MDQSTFTTLTGVTLSSSDTARFATILDVATKQLERQLGYPLDPSDWANLYNETGKTQDDCICPDAVTTDTTLDAADAVVGKYRLFDFHPTDRYFPIDPATAIYKVKLVNDSITYKTFDDEPTDENEYMVKWTNWQDGDDPVALYLDMENCGYPRWPECWRRQAPLQLAIDATWAWETVPTELNVIWADFIKDAYSGEDEGNIQSESRGSHSFTRFEKESLAQKYPALAEFAGPNGLATTPRIV